MEEIKKLQDEIYLSIGSNLGNRKKNIEKSLELISKKIGPIVKTSSIYENPPLGFQADEQFYNICIEINTSLSAKELLTKTQEIEIEIGRLTKSLNGYVSRVIDIDIIYYRNAVISESNLIIPHPKRNERNFVLIPLLEIAENFLDPELLIDLSSLKRKCLDSSILVKTINTLQLN